MFSSSTRVAKQHDKFRIAVSNVVQQNPCAPNPCINGGTCLQIPGGGYICQCPNSYAGVRCENFFGVDHFSDILLKCAHRLISIFNLGTTAAPTVPTTQANACTRNPCENGGTCLLIQGGGFICRCNVGFTGVRCETSLSKIINILYCFTENYWLCILYNLATSTAPTTQANACSQNPCQNGGTCLLIQGGGFICRCTAAFTGVRCETSTSKISTGFNYKHNGSMYFLLCSCHHNNTDIDLCTKSLSKWWNMSARSWKSIPMHLSYRIYWNLL